LAASGLAGAYGSPVLLVGDTVSATLTDELDRLGATDVVLVGGTLGPAFFVRGDQFADALAVSPFAWGQAIPVLLVQTAGVPPATQIVIDDLGLTDGIVAGGTGAVSDATYITLDGLLGSMTRLSGSNR
ncbi:MAG: cell wall-binding repeat-containing protein, partial [Coriobacteriia bacterium]